MDSTQARMQDAVTQLAAQWFVAHRGGPLSAEDRRAFDEWLRESPTHVREYLAAASAARGLRDASTHTDSELANLIEQARALPEETVVDLRNLAPTSPRTSVKRAPNVRRFIRPLGWALAAGLAALVVLAAPWMQREVQQLRGIESLATAHGEQRVWRLADGSIVHLNSGSRLEVRFTPDERTIDITQGQALFDVAHERRPFRVSAGPTQIVALGTVFDVYRKRDATLVTVVEGKVMVYESAREAPDSRPDRTGAVRVAAGEQIRIAAAHSLTTPNRVNVAGAVAWRQQKIVFEEERLADVAEEFNRYGRVPVTIEGSALADLRITGTFNAYDTESFLIFLRRLPGASVRVDEQGIRATGADSVAEARTPAPPINP